MTITQPLQAISDAAATGTDSSGSDFIRLLMQWADLTRRASDAFAHDLPDWTSLQASQFRTEEAIQARHPWEWAVIGDALIAWEASLWHTGDDVSHPACSHCRRRNAGLPDQLPLPRRGGAR